MGTNFYLITSIGSFTIKQTSGWESFATPEEKEYFKPEGAYLEKTHMGKRSAAGLYCWDCGKTLCQGGEADIHYSRSGWFEACPSCGSVPAKEDLKSSSAGIELGFTKPASEKPRGVRSCSSFSWALPPDKVLPFLREHPTEVLVVNEYEEQFTGEAFLRMLESNCPIQYTDAVGTEFC